MSLLNCLVLVQLGFESKMKKRACALRFSGSDSDHENPSTLGVTILNLRPDFAGK